VGAGRNRGKTEHGESKKVGCKVHYTSTRMYCAPSLARIYRKGRASEHIKHGPALPPGDASRLSLQGRYSQDLLEWIDNQVNLFCQI